MPEQSTLAAAHLAYYRKLLGDMVQHGEITGDVAMMVERRWMGQLQVERATNIEEHRASLSGPNAAHCVGLSVITDAVDNLRATLAQPQRIVIEDCDRSTKVNIDGVPPQGA